MGKHVKEVGLLGVLGLVSLQAAAQAPAQEPVQKVSGPIARYWLSAATNSGFGASMAAGGGGLSGLLGAALGGSGASKSLLLELESLREGSPAQADHTIPSVLGMGPMIPLIGSVPRATEIRHEEVDRERELPKYEKPEGNMRMLFFWGCGATPGPGQPIILDMQQILNGKVPENHRSITINHGPRSPSGINNVSRYAGWPNERLVKSVPSTASLAGEHTVKGNFMPDIRFAVGATNDYMEPINLNHQTTAEGMRLSWNKVPTALGFFATAMGMKDTGNKSQDMVMWNSSLERMVGGDSLGSYLPPGEVDRLVRQRVVMPANTTDCTVPKAVLDAAGGQLMMGNLNAFGPELNVVHPPRPQDPAIEWKQEYTVKLRQHASASVMPAMGNRNASPGRAAAQPSGSAAPAAPAAQAPADAPASNTKETEKSTRDMLPNILPGAAGSILKGIFGR